MPPHDPIEDPPDLNQKKLAELTLELLDLVDSHLKERRLSTAPVFEALRALAIAAASIIRPAKAMDARIFFVEALDHAIDQPTSDWDPDNGQSTTH